jgi:soluble lytic murein transglycosylase-like protein
MRKLCFALTAACLAPLAPAVHAATPAVARTLPAPVLTDQQRAAYRDIFAAIRNSDWAGAAARLDALPEGPLHSAARAELYTAKGSPKVDLDPLLALIAKAPDLPHAGQLSRLAVTRGALQPPYFVPAQDLIWQGSQPRRARAKSSTASDPIATELEAVIQPLIKDDLPSEAEAHLMGWSDRLTPEARTEYQQRVAWSYYLVGRDADARRLAEQAAIGTGEWALHGAWVAGLAAWRQGDCHNAARAFDQVATRSADLELGAAGLYWAARSDMRCKRPERVQARLRTASRSPETFYGLLAGEALGIKTPRTDGQQDYRGAEWASIAAKPNVRAALALAEIGETGLADTFIKHQARISGAQDHLRLVRLASDLNFVGTQYYLAHHAPRGTKVAMTARYPMPDWRPARGERVDQALLFAHALQESDFRVKAVSQVGATGLLQVRPGTAGDIARARGEPFDPAQLTDPVQNMEYGQSYIEKLRDHHGTGGLLPKVIAAYNAGPVPISAWNSRGMDGGDPLLYIESIPYWETRGYVPIVLRNYWIYEGKAGRGSASRKALAQGMWPRFPGLPGADAVRMEQRRTAQAAATPTSP